MMILQVAAFHNTEQTSSGRQFSLPPSDYPAINIILFHASALLWVSHSPPCMSQSKQIGWNKAKHACPWIELYMAKPPPTDLHVIQSGVQTSHCSSPCNANTVLRTELICRHLFVWFQLSAQRNVSFYITQIKTADQKQRCVGAKKNPTMLNYVSHCLYNSAHRCSSCNTLWATHAHTPRLVTRRRTSFTAGRGEDESFI